MIVRWWLKNNDHAESPEFPLHLRMGVLVFLGEVRSLTGRSGEVCRRRGE